MLAMQLLSIAEKIMVLVSTFHTHIDYFLPQNKYLGYSLKNFFIVIFIKGTSKFFQERNYVLFISGSQS